jgi:phosphohistidine phosphatase SixA
MCGVVAALAIVCVARGQEKQESGRSAGPPPELSAQPEPPARLVSELQKGGCILFIRHPKTNPDQADTDPLNLDNIKAQRHLSDEGRNQARVLGQAFRDLKLPIEKVVCSKFQRAHEAAKLLDVGSVTASVDVTEGGLVVTPRENDRRAKALRALLSTPPATGKNLIIVSHKPNLQDAAGKDFGDMSEGEVVVFRPLGEGKFKTVERIASPEVWSKGAK